MSDLLTRKLQAVCDAEKRGDRAATDREWKEYGELQAAEQRERIVRCSVSVDDRGIAHDVYRRV